MKLSISFLSSFYDEKTTIKKIEETNCDYIHVDIMDGKFVLNNNLDIDKFIELLKNTKKRKDIHLMVENPEEYIEKLSVLNPDFITFHLEANTNIDSTIDLIKSKGIGVGISIKPKTDVMDILPYLDRIDQVLVMTVEPGAGGQRFMFDMIDKIEFLSKLNNKDNYKYEINVDGGINEYTLIKCKIAGSTMAVSGSYVCKSNDYDERINKLKKLTI